MRRLGMAPMVLALALVATACGGGGGGGSSDDEPVIGAPGTTAAPVATTAPATGASGAATTFTLRVTDVRLVNSEESDNAMRVMLPAGVTTATVTLTGVPSPNRVINVCQAAELDRRLPAATCRTPASGEAVTVQLGGGASGVEIVQVGVSGSGPGGSSTAVDEVSIRYGASSRELNVRLPQIAAGEAGGRPTFALTPASTDGAYRAALTWTVIPVFGGTPASAQLDLVQGGNVINQAQAGADVRLTGNVPAPVGDVALRIQNLGSSALVAPKLSLLLP